MIKSPIATFFNYIIGEKMHLRQLDPEEMGEIETFPPLRQYVTKNGIHLNI